MQGISLRLGLSWFLATTVVVTLGWLALNYWMGPHITLPEGLVRRPWWHSWEGALFCGALMCLVTGVFATFHPLRKHRISKGN
jgi:hypothetical protein